MSLSRRLVLILLAVATVGLVTLSLVSYFALRSYLSDRVDQQARDAAPLVVRALGTQVLGLPDPAEIPFPGGDSGGPGDDDGPPDGAIGPQLPPGTFGQITDAEGNVLVSRIVSGDSTLPKPALPDDLPAAAGFGDGSPIDVASEGGGSGFRVVTQQGPNGEVALAAIPLDDLDATLSRLRTIEILVSLGILSVLAALSWWAVRVGLRPLSRIEQTAGEIAAGDMSHRVDDVDERT